MNIPVAELGKRVTELASARKPVVVYDRSGGDDAKSAVKSLAAVGLPAVLLKGGFLGWEADGLDVEKPS